MHLSYWVEPKHLPILRVSGAMIPVRTDGFSNHAFWTPPVLMVNYQHFQNDSLTNTKVTEKTLKCAIFWTYQRPNFCQNWRVVSPFELNLLFDDGRLPYKFQRNL